MANKLSNYLKCYRKRAGFSQADLAFLLGYESSATISRFERSERTPALEAVLAYEAALCVPPRDLFAGTYEKVEDGTVERAKELAEKLEVTDEDRWKARKLASLERITRPGAGALAPGPAAS